MMKKSYTCISIDDDPLFLQLLEVLIEGVPMLDLKGTFQDAIKGAVAVAKVKPDILFIDIEMPYLNGYETLSTLENCGKIIVISSNLQAEKIPDLDLVINKFVNKGSLKNSQDLEKIVREVLKLPTQSPYASH